MKAATIALILAGTLSACGSSSSRENLPVRNGPQTQDPYARGDGVSNCTINCGGLGAVN